MTAVLRLAVAEVLIFMETVPTIYDEAPKLRILGTGFDAKEEDIMLEITGKGSDRLERGDDFIVRKFVGGVDLHLLMFVVTMIEKILPSISLIHEIFNIDLHKQT